MRAQVLVLLTGALLLGGAARAIPESDVDLKYTTEVLPWFNANAKIGNFMGMDGKTIQYYSVTKTPQAACVLVFSPGRGEASLKYAELFYDLRETGCDLFSIDHRGQGFSDRLTADAQKSHVLHFSDYITDFSFFANKVVKASSYKHSVLLSHSLGGAIAAGYLKLFPKNFTAVIFSAPMMMINTGKYSQSEALAISGTLMSLGGGAKYAPGQEPYDPQETFETNDTTTSRTRFLANQKLQSLHKELQMGGATNRWVHESMKFIKSLRETADLFQVPTTIFQAGQDDVVEAEGEDQVCTLNSLNCSLIVFPNAKHNIFHEVDTVRNGAVEKVRFVLTTF